MPSGWAPWGLISRVRNSSCLTALGVFGCGGVGHWYARSHNRACRLHFLCQQRPLTCRYKKPVIDRFFFVKLERNQSVSKARVKRAAASVPVAHERHRAAGTTTARQSPAFVDELERDRRSTCLNSSHV